jgi:hypothetical protein
MVEPNKRDGLIRDLKAYGRLLRGLQSRIGRETNKLEEKNEEKTIY